MIGAIFRGIGKLISGLTRAIAWLIRLSLRYGWRYRKLLAPLYVSLWLAIAALLLHGTPDMWVNTLGGGAFAAVCLAVWMRRRRVRHGRRLRRAKQAYAWSSLAAAAAWLTVLATWTLPPAWIAGVHTALTLATWGPWIWDRRVRRVRLLPQVQTWDERLAADGRRLKGTQLTNVKPGTGNVEWEGIVRGEPGLFTTSAAVSAQPYIASAYEVSGPTIVVEPEPSERLDTARIMKVRSNKTFAKTSFDESWHELHKGSVPLTTYPDGSRGRLAIYVPKAGTRSSVWTGDSGSGKSKGMSTGKTQVTATGLSVPWAGCPQGGQSFPAWAGRDGLADFIARDEEQCLEMLLALRGAMHARSAVLAELPFQTSTGKIRRGVARYDPDLLVVVDGQVVALWKFMPILDVSIDEIPQIFAYDNDSPKLVAEVVKLVSKTGGRLNLGLQMPSVPELGGLDTIRQNVKGNVVAFRNSEPVSKGMVLSSWMPSPSDIPVHPPGQPEEHTLGTCVLESVAPGSGRATFSRTPSIPDEDDFEWVERAIARRPALDQITAKGAGLDYYDQWKTRPMQPKSVRSGWARQLELRGREATEASDATEAAEAGETAAAPQRETITVATVPAAGAPRKGTLASRAVAYLDGRPTPASTSTIAQALGAPRGNVSQALKRESQKNGSRVYQPRDGEWGLRGKNQQTKEAA